jgi:type II secretory pathway pseudopilin PulG
MTRKRLTVAGVVIVVVAILAGAAVAGVRGWRDSHRTELERAMAMAPGDAQRLTWTDWAGVRDELGLALSDEPSTAEVTELVDRGFEADLTSTSALVESAPVMQAQLGFSPASVDWELFTQSESAAAITLGLPDYADFDDLADKLGRLGYAEPSGDSNVWRGNPDLLSQVGTLTPELTFVALDADERVIVSSDTLDGAEQAVEAATDDDDPSGGLGEVVASIAEADEPLSGAFYTGDQVCAALSMGQADSVDQDQGEQLLSEAGEINPLTGFAMTKDRGGDLRVAMAFETEEQARTNADTRAVLAAGPAPGQGGDFTDRFTLGPVTAEGLVVTMELTPTEGNYVLSDLSNGPLLFATC